MFTSNLVVRMTRDESEFINRGVTVLNRQAMETLGNAFEVLPSDETYLSDVMTEVAAKDALRESCTFQIQLISGFFEQQWGLSSTEYKKLRVTDLTTQSDEKFLRTCRLVHDAGTDYLADLTPIGLTQAILDTFTADAQSLEDKLNSIITKADTRQEKTKERIEKGNELYGYVAKYCKIGQLIWENVDPVKVEDYIIYKTVHPPPPAVTGLAYDLLTGTLTWAGVSGINITYEAAFAPDMPEPIFIQIYDGAGRSVVYDPGGPDNYLFKVRARQGTTLGPWSEVLVVVR